jgi:hypothetical protein
MDTSQDMTTSEKHDWAGVCDLWSLAWNYERVLIDSYDPVEQELACFNRDYHGWDLEIEVDDNNPQQYQEQIEELRWKSRPKDRDPEFWKTQASTDSVVKRVARQADVECKETSGLPLCISTQSKARIWAKEIMKANCFTKSGNDHSPPKFGLIVNKSGLPIFRSLVPNKERNLKILKYPADFILLFEWMHERVLCNDEGRMEARDKGSGTGNGKRQCRR